MANVGSGKYQLKAIYEEIGLFDRKLAHLMKYDVFESDAAREAAAKKMNAKRELLVKSALQMTAEGVESSPHELPRSMRAEGEPEPEIEAPKPAGEAAAEPELPSAASRVQRRQGSAFAGTSLDWEKGIREYMSKRAKA